MEALLFRLCLRKNFPLRRYSPPFAPRLSYDEGKRTGKGGFAHAAAQGQKNYESDRVFYLPVTQIVPNRAQPRVHFDEAALAELAGSIRRYGVLQP